jgi:hypothetical protein
MRSSSSTRRSVSTKTVRNRPGESGASSARPPPAAARQAEPAERRGPHRRRLGARQQHAADARGVEGHEVADEVVDQQHGVHQREIVARALDLDVYALLCTADGLHLDAPRRDESGRQPRGRGLDVQWEDVVRAGRERHQHGVAPGLRDAAIRAVAAEHHHHIAARIAQRLRAAPRVAGPELRADVQHDDLGVELEILDRTGGDAQQIAHHQDAPGAAGHRADRRARDLVALDLLGRGARACGDPAHVASRHRVGEDADRRRAVPGFHGSAR